MITVCGQEIVTPFYTTECPIYSYYSILGVNGLLPTCGTHKIQLQPKLDGTYKKENANQYDSQRY